MALFRKIVVDGHEYEWKYTFDDYDWQEPSHLVFRSVDRKLKIILYFRSPGWEIGKCPFNAGLPAVKDGGLVIVNMNQPRFVAELLRYLLEYRLGPSSRGILVYRDGLDILHELGYRFEYSLGSRTHAARTEN